MTNTPATRRVRRAAPSDVATLARFRFQFRAGRHPVVEDEAEFVARCESWMRTRVHPDSRWRVWILEENGAAIGTLWIQMIEKIPNPGREGELHAYVSNFFVLPEHRNKGGGKLLLDAAVAECRAFHTDTMFLWPSEESRPLYERNGFAPPRRLLIKEL
jgi:GNAT superfamily N-acetyltransferase